MTGSGAVGTGAQEAPNEEAVAKRFPQGGLLSLTGVGAVPAEAPREPFATLSRTIVPWLLAEALTIALTLAERCYGARRSRWIIR